MSWLFTAPPRTSPPTVQTVKQPGANSTQLVSCHSTASLSKPSAINWGSMSGVSHRPPLSLGASEC